MTAIPIRKLPVVISRMIYFSEHALLLKEKHYHYTTPGDVCQW